jgi:hypothetical protein
MNLIDFEQIGGYRLKQPTFGKMQEAYFEILKAQIGHFGIADVGNFIISGCEIVGVNITSGLMYIDGELCPFETVIGDANTKIKKEIELNDLDFADGLPKSVFRKSTAVVDAVNGIALSVFVKVPKVNELVNELTDWGDIQNIPQVVIDPYNPATIPAEKTVLERLELLEKKNAVFKLGGAMVLWNDKASLIPWGWHEVADWKGRMPVGIDDTIDNNNQLVNPEFGTLIAGDLVPGKIGGKKTHKLIQSELPIYNLTRDVGKETPTGGNETIWSSGPGNHATQIINSGGGDQAHPILNPYRTVLFIEWTGLP